MSRDVALPAVPNVKSIAEEERLLGSCDCGGAWELRYEEVIPLDGGRWADTLVFRCVTCGTLRRGIFDVTALMEVAPRVWSGWQSE
jgi:hypothetical protein